MQCFVVMYCVKFSIHCVHGHAASIIVGTSRVDKLPAARSEGQRHAAAASTCSQLAVTRASKLCCVGVGNLIWPQIWGEPRDPTRRSILRHFLFVSCPPPSPRGSRGRVRTDVFLQEPGFVGRIRGVIFIFICILTPSTAVYSFRPPPRAPERREMPCTV